ncbi:glycerol-3-phosphate 1-O-acyltransferase PlsY [Culicoidibacter larvae]|uniref:Glycerol-3-phosphate acyltransferase n=1 Tax=Culicoidibacter larvae TaxID=2579976 RepID=A0A5R8Q9G9_9FIRM|nr:glycerol-3-phosphate 1-O-acyltransferase PlsY [Culicoidibacter larvae]TLG72564.1 glycerol-3-phosphate 1-O-acyltransferase PlsY [Culicoidibacter larvae]
MFGFTQTQLITMAIAFVFAYLYGSVNLSVVISKFFYGKDIRQYGSKGSGTTNTIRVLGFHWGIVVFLFDFSKVLIPYFIVTLLGFQVDPGLMAVGAVIGQCYPIFMKFRGGKGVASTGAFLLFYHIPYALVGIGIFMLVLRLSKMVSLSSLLAILGVTVLSALLQEWNLTIAMTILLLITYIRHYANIKRIFKGEESKVSIFD